MSDTSTVVEGRTIDTSDEELLLSPERAAKRLNIGRTLMFELIKTGEVESVLIKRRRMIHPEALTDYVARLRGLSSPASPR